jgi:hypothetical protein
MCKHKEVDTSIHEGGTREKHVLTSKPAERNCAYFAVVTFKCDDSWNVVRTFKVQADVPIIIFELQFVILKVWTIPNIANVDESGTQDRSSIFILNPK